MPITDDERVLLGRLNGVAVRQQGPMTQLERPGAATERALSRWIAGQAPAKKREGLRPWPTSSAG